MVLRELLYRNHICISFASDKTAWLQTGNISCVG